MMMHKSPAATRVCRATIWMTGLILASHAAAQSSTPKPSLDTSTFRHWPREAEPSISADGHYVLYTNQRWDPPRYRADTEVLVVRALDNHWQFTRVGGKDGRLTTDGRRALFMIPGDSLCTLTLGDSVATCVAGVTRFELIGHSTAQTLLYQTKADSSLVLRDLSGGQEHSYPHVVSYVLAKNDSILALVTRPPSQGGAGSVGGGGGAGASDSTQRALTLIRLPEAASASSIWQGAGIDQVVLDSNGTQVAFVVATATHEQTPGRRALWLNKPGEDHAVLVMDDSALGASGLRLAGLDHFSDDGARLFIRVQQPDIPPPAHPIVPLVLWSYTDPKLQPDQLTEDKHPSYEAVLTLATKQVLRLARDYESVNVSTAPNGDSVAVVSYQPGDGDEWNWNRTGRPKYFLESTTTGARTPIEGIGWPELSPDGHYVMGDDADRHDIICYDIAAGVTRNLTAQLPIPQVLVPGTKYGVDEPGDRKFRGLQVEAWLPHDAGVVVGDAYDLWLLDPSGRAAPVNLTNGYGRRHQIGFSLLERPYGQALTARDLLLDGFNYVTKDDGIYRGHLDHPGDPETLTTGPYLYTYWSGGHDPIKAADSNVYLVRRQSTNEFPNWFSTRDFKTYEPVTEVHPERAYNWMTSELISFTTLDGRQAQAIVYKPENFDSTRRYPVIFNYYEHRTQELHKYWYPLDNSYGVDIAAYVSAGYVVVTPDIDFTIGAPGQSVMNSVMGVAMHMMREPWVDGKHMGLIGHSFGGFETYYLVTHTPLFAAAVASAGIVDFVRGYGDLLDDHSSRQWFYELHQYRLGATLWERPDMYHDNSAILHADRVTTPILSIANPNDHRVQYTQGIEWFMAMRRLGKPAWLLQYDGQGHGEMGEAAVDRLIREKQFFDHYLKGAPPPKWMTEGIPGRLKGIESGLELDNSGKEPGPGLGAGGP